jgi:hypothetical protein
MRSTHFISNVFLEVLIFYSRFFFFFFLNVYVSVLGSYDYGSRVAFLFVEVERNDLLFSHVCNLCIGPLRRNLTPGGLDCIDFLFLSF